MEFSPDAPPPSRHTGPTRTGPPDFIGLGAQLAGGYGWHALILHHPDVVAPADGPDGAGFFLEYCAREMTDADIARYHERFAKPAGTISGEFGPRYLADPWTPPLLVRAAPQAKLLVMLRDPIQRYLLTLRQRQHEVRDRDEAVLMTDVLNRGRYATHLRALHRFVDPAQVLVLQYERCRTDVVGEYRRTMRFLGLSEDAVPERVLKRATRGGDRMSLTVRGRRAVGLPDRLSDRWRANAPKRWRRRERVVITKHLDAELLASLHAVLDPEVDELTRTIEHFDPALWRHFRDRR